jgi:MFS family permease
MGNEKTSLHHHDVAPVSNDGSSDLVVGYETELNGLPPGYFRSKYFIGSLLATGMGLWCGVSSFALAAPVLGLINEDIGPDTRFAWISLSYNCVLAVCLAPVGRLSDIFGRRWCKILFLLTLVLSFHSLPSFSQS